MVLSRGVLSPILFSVYFVGVLGYADDVVLLAPSPSAMCKMLALCGEFANEYSAAFYANKSKCLVLQPRQNRGLPSSNIPPLCFHVGDNDIDYGHPME